MLNYLRAPEPLSADFYDRARFRLTWNVNITLTFAFIILSLTAIWIQPSFVVYYGIGFVFTVGAIFYLRKTRKYRIIATIFCVGMYALVGMSMVCY